MQNRAAKIGARLGFLMANQAASGGISQVDEPFSLGANWNN